MQLYNYSGELIFSQSSNYINILDYPRMDGETSDTPRIRRAIATIPTKTQNPTAYYNGGILLFPRGKYEIDSTITATNIGIIGEHGTEFKGTGTGYMFDISFDGELAFPHVYDGNPMYQWRNFPVLNCIFNGGGLMDGLKHSAGHNIGVENCIFCDTKNVGYNIVDGSKYYMRHVTFRGLSTDTSINTLAALIGGSDHNFDNIIVCNYTKGMEISAPNSTITNLHIWCSHRERSQQTAGIEIKAGGIVLNSPYVDTLKEGIIIVTDGSVFVNSFIGYNSSIFNVYDATYIKINNNAVKLFVSGASVNDTNHNGSFVNIPQAEATNNMTFIGVTGNCSNVYNKY